jgi:uncharacterized protein (TIGR02145 family)
VYVWLENGQEIPGATGDAYTNPTGKSAAGTYVYTRMAKIPDCDWQASNSFIVCVLGVDKAPDITPPARNCSGEDVVFTVPPVPGAKYDWDNTGGTAKDNTYTFASATPGLKSVRVRVAGAVGGLNCSSGYSEASITLIATPGITTQPSGAEICPGEKVELSVAATGATSYRWLKNGEPATEGSGADKAAYTTAALQKDATFRVVIDNAGACSVTSNEVKVAIKTSGCCDAPGATVTFTAFNPCTTVPVNSHWALTDDRENNNKQTYKVRIMADGRYWMVQDLKFGKNCNKTDFTGSSDDQTNKVAKGYYGDCRRAAKSGAGYFYDWAAVLNKAGAYYGANKEWGCSGSNNTCQGICPKGWHVPTSKDFSNANTKFKEIDKCTNQKCWNASSKWEGVLAGVANPSTQKIDLQDNEGHYWSSSVYDERNAQYLRFTTSIVTPMDYSGKNYGRLLRCIRNY